MNGVILIAGLLAWGGAAGVARAGAAPAAKSAFAIECWDSSRGLPQGSVFALTQTRDGYLWFGTLSGLVRFDGTRFRVFDEGNTPGLNSSQVVGLLEDTQSNLWIALEPSGITLAREDQVTSLEMGRGGRESRVLSMCEDAVGAVWFYLANGRLLRYHNGQTNVFQAGSELSSTQPTLRRIVAEASGLVWVGLDNGQSAFNPRETLTPPTLPLTHAVPVMNGRLDYLLASQDGGYWRIAENRVQKWNGDRLERDLGPYPWAGGARVSISAACEDRDGNLIVGTINRNAGVYWYDRDGGVAHLTRADGLSHDGILSLCMDREGDLWVGTDGGGLNRVRRKVFEQPPALREGVVYSVSADARGGVWVGFNNAGATYWTGSNTLDYGQSAGLPSDVRAVLVDSRDRVWAGTWKGVYRLQGRRFEPVLGPIAVLAIHEDRSGNLWFGTQGGLVRWNDGQTNVFTTADGLSGNLVQAIADDAEGNLWVGTEDAGLNCWRDGRFTVYHKQPDGLPSDRITSLHVDDDGVLWIGTGSGLARFHRGAWTRYTTREGLVSNSVGYMIEDHEGSLWLGSAAGLMRLGKASLNDFARGRTNIISCRAFGTAEGLPSAECTQGSQPAACRTREGRLWFPTIKGLAAVSLAHLQPNTNPPPVIIEALLVDGQRQRTRGLRAMALESLIVPAGRERLEIQYTSLNLAAPERARFKYRMEGHETSWTEAGNDRFARYSKLPAGQYRFVVTACNEDGYWNAAGSALTVVVLPPFWRTWWFLAASTVVLLGAIVAIVHHLSTQKLQRQLVHMKQEEALHRERSRIARDIHDQLGANLTQIGFLGEMIESDRNDPAEVETHAQQITQTSRETTRALDEIVWAVNPSNDTLDGLITYVCKHVQEYLAIAGLRYRLDVPDALPRTPLPPEVRHNVFLAIKEGVTNIVRHAQATEAHLRLTLANEHFTLELEDNGHGLAGMDPERARTRNGLTNMRKRMEEIGGQFTLEPVAQGGTRVRLTVPLAVMA